MTALPQPPTHITIYVGTQGDRIELPLRKSFVINSRKMRRCELHEAFMSYEELWQVMTGDPGTYDLGAREKVLAAIEEMNRADSLR